MRALLIDDHPLIQEIVPAVLAKALGEVAVSTEGTLEAGLARASSGAAPDLVLLDLGLPGCVGLDAIARFRVEFPELPLVVLSANCERESILGALEAGAVGYIPKTSKPDVMIAALKVIAAGGTYVPPEALEEPVKGAPHRRGGLELTGRQKEVFRNKRADVFDAHERIALELGIAPNTVKQHAHAIFNALGVSTRAEAVIAAQKAFAETGRER